MDANQKRYEYMKKWREKRYEWAVEVDPAAVIDFEMRRTIILKG